MAKPRVIFHRGGMTDLLSSEGVSRRLNTLSARVADAARATAPVESGGYKASIRHYTEQHPKRVVGHVIADIDYGLVVEAGTGNLSRALDAGGD